MTTVNTAIKGMPIGVEARGYMTYTDGNGISRQDSGWFYYNGNHVVCRRIGGRRHFVYRSALDINLGFCEHLAFVPDDNAR